MKNNSKTLEDQSLINSPDFFRNIIADFLQSVVDKQFNDHINANSYERCETRNGYRNGYFTRSLTTRVGSIELRIPRDREGNFSVDLYQRYQRAEKAFFSVLVEAYLQGVSTRKVSKVVESLCGESISKSTVSSLVEDLQETLKEWRTRELKDEYAYVLLDALVERVRQGGKVIKMACVVAVGIRKDGGREIIGCDVVNSETKTEWSDFIKSLKDRGLKVTSMFISDANQGLQDGISTNYSGIPWQRCQVHFFRNLMDKLPRKLFRKYSDMLKNVYGQSNLESANLELKKLVEELVKDNKESVADWLEENIPETLNLYNFAREHRKKIRSTNMIERVNRELRRRSRVISIYPNEDSCLRMLTAICQQISEGWEGRNYLPREES